VYKVCRFENVVDPQSSARQSTIGIDSGGSTVVVIASSSSRSSDSGSRSVKYSSCGSCSSMEGPSDKRQLAI
jgi:hypothetical protein